MVYLFLPILVIIAALLGSLARGVHYDKISVFLIFLFIVLVSGTRYGVGVDYVNYENIFYNINGFYDSITLDINNIDGLEPGFLLINKIFGFSKYGFYGLIFFMSLVTLGLIHAAILKLPIKYQYLAYFILITHAFVFLMQNQIRQAASIAIFIFSVRYINNGCKRNFFGLNIVSAIIFHYSALAVLPLYAVRHISLTKIKMIIVLSFVLPVSIFGGFNHLLYEVVKNISIYDVYLSTSFSDVSQLSIINIITVMYFFLLIYFFDRDSNEGKILFFGLVLSCVFSNFSLLERLSSYFLYIKILSIPMLIYGIRNSSNKYIVLISLLIYSIAMYANAIAINSGGNIPYLNLIEGVI